MGKYTIAALIVAFITVPECSPARYPSNQGSPTVRVGLSLSGWGRRIRTPTYGSRVRCPTVRRAPSAYLLLCACAPLFYHDLVGLATSPARPGCRPSSLFPLSPIVDGNERTALAAMGIFLELKGRTLTATDDELLSFIRRYSPVVREAGRCFCSSRERLVGGDSQHRFATDGECVTMGRWTNLWRR